MREQLVRRDLVECVIGLGANLFYNSPMEACILICRTTKEHERKGQILFINAVNEVERKNAQSYLDEEHILKIAQAYEKYESVEGFARKVNIDDVGHNDYSLNIALYVKPETEETPDIAEPVSVLYQRWLTAYDNMNASYAKLNELLPTEE